MFEIGRDHQHLSGSHRHFAVTLGSQPKMQGALEDVSDLLVFVRVRRHLIALLETHVRNHHALSRDQLAGDAALHRFRMYFRPTIVLGSRFAGVRL